MNAANIDENPRPTLADAIGSGRTIRDQMALPEGNTCNDCYAFRFCIGIGCTSHGATHCDYWPNRFRPNTERSHGSENH
jgi:hypothetical protein